MSKLIETKGKCEIENLGVSGDEKIKGDPGVKASGKVILTVTFWRNVRKEVLVMECG